MKIPKNYFEIMKTNIKNARALKLTLKTYYQRGIFSIAVLDSDQYPIKNVTVYLKDYPAQRQGDEIEHAAVLMYHYLVGLALSATLTKIKIKTVR